MKWDKDRTVQSFLLDDCEAGRWTDLTLVGEDGFQISVHKMVLAASSSFIESMLKEADDQEDMMILLPSIPGWVLKLIVKMVYGSFALDAWALGNELIVEAAEILGLVPQKLVHLNVMNISELTANFSDKETIREIELLSNDIFKEINFTEEIPMDIIEFFEDSIKDEETKPNVKIKEPFVRKSVIQHAVSVRKPNVGGGGGSYNKENLGGLNDKRANDSLSNEKKILSCEQMSMQRRKLLVKLLTCSRCHHVFQTPEDKEKHVLCQGEALLHNCIFKCRKICTTFSVLCQHVCQEHRLNVKNMVKKLTRDPAKKSEPIKCRICQASVASAQALQNHFKGAHPDELPYICDICGHKTHEEVRFKRHMVCHMPETPREYCNICFKEFRNKVSLRTHRNMVHKLGRKYTCAFCGKVLYSSQYLKKHEATHTGQKFKGVVCKFCGKTVEYTKLKNHELTHTGEKPFKCSDCDYRCIQRSNLRIHMKGIHKKDLPRLAVGQKRYSGSFMDGTAGNNDPFDLRSVFHQKTDK